MSDPSSDAPKPPEIKPIGRGATKVLVITCIALIFGISALSAWMLTRYNTDPEILEQIDDARDQIQSEADSARAAIPAADTSATPDPQP